eukprot:RCo029507
MSGFPLSARQGIMQRPMRKIGPRSTAESTDVELARNRELLESRQRRREMQQDHRRRLIDGTPAEKRELQEELRRFEAEAAQAKLQRQAEEKRRDREAAATYAEIDRHYNQLLHQHEDSRRAYLRSVAALNQRTAEERRQAEVRSKAAENDLDRQRGYFFDRVPRTY